MMNTALVIMAAGIGSRYGGGIKQLEAVGQNGEIIMDYSIHDAIEVGFRQIVFIIRKDLKQAFHDAIGHRIEKICADHQVGIQYAFQELDQLPGGVSLPEGRTKPWGTGQAVLACKGLIDCPFAVINADDYYGKDAFVHLHRFLSENCQPNRLCMAGFVLKNTLSDHGGVTRGICKVDESGRLTDVLETRGIVKSVGPGGEVQARAGEQVLDVESLVSMNMWGLTPAFIDLLEQGFREFFEENGPEKILTAEYLLPIYIDKLLKRNAVTVDVLTTRDRWFGVTYQQDKPAVVEAFAQLTAKGVYRNPLFSDLSSFNKG